MNVFSVVKRKAPTGFVSIVSVTSPVESKWRFNILFYTLRDSTSNQCYWTQKLYDWKQSSIPFSVSSRKTKIVIQNFKFEFLIICIRLQKLWVEVEVSNKWIGNNMKNHAPEVNTAGLILQWFNNTSKKMVTEVQSIDIGSTNDNSIYSSHLGVGVADSPYTNDGNPKKKSKKELEQERLSYAEAIRLEEQINEEQRAQIERDEEIARQWDEEERQRAMDEAKSAKKIDWNDPSVIRYHTQKLKPKTVSQARRNMIKYLKNQGNYKISDFKGMS
ncbi:hypothetical protein Tco_0348937 [Tanacetum coccineum]